MRNKLSPAEIAKAAAVGRLLLKEFNSWEEFSGASIPRDVNRKQKRADAAEMTKGIKRFLHQNFQNARPEDLIRMHEELSRENGLRRNLPDFEKDFFKIRESRRKQIPGHAKVDISLWGLGYDFPEKQMCDSLAETLEDLCKALADGGRIALSMKELRTKRETVRSIPRRESHCSRAVLLFSHSLAECFINGLAWEYLKSSNSVNLSKPKQKQLADQKSVDFECKLRGYNGVLFNVREIGIGDDLLSHMISSKDYRDAITHPSPFGFKSKAKSVRDFEKLDRLYLLNPEFVIEVASSVYSYVRMISVHKLGDEPFWLKNLRDAVEKLRPKIQPRES